MKVGDKVVIGLAVAALFVAMYFYNPKLDDFIGYYIYHHNTTTPTLNIDPTGNYYLFSTYKYSGLHKEGKFIGVLGMVFNYSGFSIEEVDKEYADMESEVNSLHLPSDTIPHK